MNDVIPTLLATAEGSDWTIWVAAAVIGSLIAIGKFLNDGGHLRRGPENEKESDKGQP